jgi:hypothetical protein
MPTPEEGSELYAVIRDIYNSHRDLPSVNPINKATLIQHNQ